MRRISGVLVRFFEAAVPDPYVFAVGLTLLTALLAAIFAPHHGAGEIAAAWVSGLVGKQNIFEFALQMVLVLVTGYALASSAPVGRLLDGLAARPKTPKDAVTLTLLVSSLACWLNWGFGLVVAGLLARAIARRMRIDFGWLVAAAYTGFLIWASGLSSSIALAQATPGSKLNIVQALTGQVLSLRQTIFTTYNLVPVVVLLVVLPLVFRSLAPRDEDVVEAQGLPDDILRPSTRLRMDQDDKTAARPTLATRLNNAWILNLILVAAGFTYLIQGWIVRGVSLDIGSVILIFFLLGLLLHWTPIAYVRAIERAARVTGPLLIQYPLYGGIMAIMTTTGLAGVIAQGFLTFSTASTLPFWSYVSSIIISLFVPSGGGHWAVQGPFAVPAAVKLHASLPATAMAVAIGEQVANMIQPFWALPVLAIAGIGLQRVMAYTAVSFAIAFVVFGVALLVLIPK